MIDLVRQVALMLLLGLYAVQAQAINPNAQAELDAALKEAQSALLTTPSIPLLDQATLKLPSGQGFIPVPAASRLMRAMGNQADERLLGLVVPLDDAPWMMVVKYEKSGYIKDDDAKEWNADDLYKSLQEGTEAGNEERRKSGIAEIEMTGWVEKPTYLASGHQLLWSVGIKDKRGTNADQGINYNTYVLGREGYISMNLITDRQLIEQLKPVAQGLLSALEFNGGKKYADFNVSTDKVAEYGLAALITGVAAKKLGLLAVIAAFFAKFIKVILLVGAGALYGVKKWLGGKKNNEDENEERAEEKKGN